MVLAHSGHWAISLLYVAPVVIVMAALWIQGRRERGDGDEPQDQPEREL